ncbi:predicted protein, partial [Nematostella vectensis]
RVIRDVLSSYLKQFTEYKHEMFERLCTLLSDLIKTCVTELCDEPCKVIVNVFIGAIKGQGIDAATQCTWTPDCDKFATASFQNETLFAVGVVFTV